MSWMIGKKWKDDQIMFTQARLKKKTDVIQTLIALPICRIYYQSNKQYGYYKKYKYVHHDRVGKWKLDAWLLCVVWNLYRVNSKNLTLFVCSLLTFSTSQSSFQYHQVIWWTALFPTNCAVKGRGRSYTIFLLTSSIVSSFPYFPIFT